MSIYLCGAGGEGHTGTAGRQHVEPRPPDSCGVQEPRANLAKAE